LENAAGTSDQFRNVDATPNPATHVQYLQSVSSLDMMKRIKERSIDLLDLRAGQRVLDVGCGVGDEVRLIAQRVGKDGLSVGIDNSAVMIAEARKHAEGLDLSVDFRVGNVYDLDYTNDFFDACRIERVLQHLEDPEKALDEMIRVTKPGGAIGALEPDWHSLIVDLADPELARKIVGIVCDNLSRNPWIGRQLYRRFHGAGLVDVVFEPFALTLTDPALRRLYYLDGAIAFGKEHGLLSEAELAAYSAQLDLAKAKGYLLATISAFVVVGRKPHATERYAQ
jgi:ubiquinone/menaquinone biosynthesis C-methylase UbiE